jgi:hypothetical protein
MAPFFLGHSWANSAIGQLPAPQKYAGISAKLIMRSFSVSLM